MTVAELRKRLEDFEEMDLDGLDGYEVVVLQGTGSEIEAVEIDPSDQTVMLMGSTQ